MNEGNVVSCEVVYPWSNYIYLGGGDGMGEIGGRGK